MEFDRAKRILEALVGKEINFRAANEFVDPPVVGSLVLALVEGARAMLETWNRDFDSDRKGQRVESSAWYGRKEGYQMALIDHAQAVEPRMKEAGLEVPE